MPRWGDFAHSLAREIEGDDGQSQVADIITFVESDWGLGLQLYPVQRIILKAHYGVALDDNPHGFDLYAKIPEDHPEFDQLSDVDGFYKYRVPVPKDWGKTEIDYLTEVEYLAYLHKNGKCNISEVEPGKELRRLILSIGRRSGKTLLASCIAAYESYKLIKLGDPHSYYGLPDSNLIQIISVATSKNQAGLLYMEASGHFRKCEFFNSYSASQTQSFSKFQTPSDIESSGRWSKSDPTCKASINVTFLSSVSRSIRGAGCIVAILDEAAHFVTSGGSSAEEVMTAILPALAAFSPKHPKDKTKPVGDVESRLILISTPLGRDGEFYDSFMMGMKGGKAGENYLCIQAPTWEVNPSIDPSFFVEAYEKNAQDFFQEFGADFTNRTRNFITDHKDLWACVDPTLRPLFRAPSRRPHFLGLDFGLVNDGTAVAIGHVNQHQEVIVDYVDWMIAGEGDYAKYDRLDHKDIIDWVEDLSTRFMISEGFFDQWSGPLFEQLLHDRGLTQIKCEALTKIDNSKIYQNFREMLWQKRVKFYNWPIEDERELCPYLDEIMALQEEKVSKNIIKVEAPSQDNIHDDRPDAVARMVWLATQRLGKPVHFGRRGSGGGKRPMSNREYIRRRKKALQTGSHPDRMVPKSLRRRRRGKGRLK